MPARISTLGFRIGVKAGGWREEGGKQYTAITPRPALKAKNGTTIWCAASYETQPENHLSTVPSHDTRGMQAGQRGRGRGWESVQQLQRTEELAEIL